MDSRVGKRLGNYHLTYVLGSGGFSQVYLSEHIYLKRLVALKVLPTQVSSKDEQAFLQEGQIIASLEHPNILRVLDFGIDAHLSYLVMEYAPNGTLRRRHPKGSLLHRRERKHQVIQTLFGRVLPGDAGEPTPESPVDGASVAWNWDRNTASSGANTTAPVPDSTGQAQPRASAGCNAPEFPRDG